MKYNNLNDHNMKSNYFNPGLPSFKDLCWGCDQEKIETTVYQIVPDDEIEDALEMAEQEASLCKWCRGED